MLCRRTMLAALLAFSLVTFPTPRLRADAGPEDPKLGRDRVLPDVALDGVSLEDMVQYLQSQSPNFKAIVVREPGDEGGYPMVRIRIKDVSVGLLLELLTTSYPGIDISTIDGKGGPIHVIRVVRQEGDKPKTGADASDGVRVYRLSAAIEQLVQTRAESQLFPAPDEDKAKPAPARKEALNNILALVKAALTLTDGDRNPPTLQVHEETQTLLFKGTQRQREVVEDALAALISPNKEFVARTAVERLQGLLQQAQAEIDRDKTKLEDLSQRYEERLAQAKTTIQQRDEELLASRRQTQALDDALHKLEREAGDREARSPSGSSDPAASGPQKSKFQGKKD